MQTPERTTAEVFPRYLGGKVLADRATLKWPGLFARRYRFPRVVNGFLVPATEFYGRDDTLAHLSFACAAMLSARTAGSTKRVAAFAQLLALHLTEKYTNVAPQRPDYRGGLPVARLRKIEDYAAAAGQGRTAFSARIRQGPHDPVSSPWVDGRWSRQTSMSSAFTMPVISSRPPGAPAVVAALTFTMREAVSAVSPPLSPSPVPPVPVRSPRTSIILAKLARRFEWLGQRGLPTNEAKQEGIEKMQIKRIGSQPSSKGPAEWFTGTVRIDPLFQANAPARASGASVTFEPGARTAWHTHPLGQTLIVTAGCGLAQREGGPIEEIHPGEVVWFPPGEKHWHGATPATAMTHIAIQEALDGKVVDWMEKVSDEQYQAGSKAH